MWISRVQDFTFKERFGAEFRWEIFNIFNHPIIANPYGSSNTSFLGADPSKARNCFRLRVLHARRRGRQSAHRFRKQPRDATRLEAHVLVGAAGARENLLSFGGLHASLEAFSVKVEPAPPHRPSNAIFRDACIAKPWWVLQWRFSSGASLAPAMRLRSWPRWLHQLFSASPILDHPERLDYTRRFDSVQLPGLRGRVLCRNARFNRKCAAATKHTVFARA